jgi:hypothetical protein
MKKLLKKLSQIVFVHTANVFVAVYPFGKWQLSKEVNVFQADKLVQTVWYIANVQIGVWHSTNEVSVYA